MLSIQLEIGASRTGVTRKGDGLLCLGGDGFADWVRAAGAESGAQRFVLFG